MEIAFVSSNKVRAEIEMARGGIINRILNVYYRNREMFISTLLIGNNIANIVYSMAMERFSPMSCCIILRASSASGANTTGLSLVFQSTVVINSSLTWMKPMTSSMLPL